MTNILIPVKNLMRAKSRLSPVLSADQRAGLVLAMLRDLLGAIRSCHAGDIFLIASDETVFQVGEAFNVIRLREENSEGYNQAILIGLDQVNQNEPVAILPADLPAVASEDIAALIAEPAPASAFVRIVPDRLKIGTNALFLSKPNLISPAFGDASFAKHKSAASTAGITPMILNQPSLACDIDEVEDLVSFQRLGVSSATLRFLKSTRVGQLESGIA